MDELPKHFESVSVSGYPACRKTPILYVKISARFISLLNKTPSNGDYNASTSFIFAYFNFKSELGLPMQKTIWIPQPNQNDNPSQLQSIPLLQSLKNINQQRDFQAPYIHDLNNRYKVRTLFVETQDLPMVDIQLTF